MASLSLVHPEAAQSLALALVASSNAPALLLDGELKLIAASTSFCRAFGLDPVEARGRRLFNLGDGEWDTPGLRSLLTTALAGHPQVGVEEMDLECRGRPSRRLGLNVQKLDYDGGGAVRLLLSISDLADGRLRETLEDARLEDKTLQLQELQHRIANSLQIIASVLMLNARKEHSDETKQQLYDAHSRVMSVAALQRQLAASGLAEVELRRYFTDLCHSIGASMIGDEDRLSLQVSTDDSIATADVSMALGLVVTELVINALKHAFPGGRSGAIWVEYRANLADWTLTVRDDGIGLPEVFEIDSGRGSGLGAGIVGALARQLRARVQTTRLSQGTSVSLIRTEDFDRTV
ncbi:MAG TPA: histidine kinase dimerization/phosphoacceptor domain -containing protein [Caulobacteraceae bacterium]